MKIDILKWPCDAMAHRAFARQTLQNQLAPTVFHRSSAARQRKTAQLCQRPGRAKTCQHCALDLLHCHCRTLPDICAMCESQFEFGTCRQVDVGVAEARIA